MLDPATPDTITWMLTSNGKYSTWSTYKAQLIGSTTCSFNNLVWKTWGPPNADSLHGLWCRIGSGRLTASLRGVGLTPLSVNCADFKTKLQNTSSSNADTQDESGKWLPPGSPALLWFRTWELDVQPSLTIGKQPSSPPRRTPRVSSQ